MSNNAVEAYSKGKRLLKEWRKADTVERHLEGINIKVKTTRRCAYGFRDTRYFFSKIYENTRKPSQNWLSHTDLNQKNGNQQGSRQV